MFGALIGWLYNRAVEKRPNGEMLKRFGVLLASGLIVGESLLGVLNAGLIVATEQRRAARNGRAGFRAVCAARGRRFVRGVDSDELRVGVAAGQALKATPAWLPGVW